MGQAAFVFIKGALGPCGHQGLTSHHHLASGSGMSGCGEPLLAWSSLAGAPLLECFFPEAPLETHEGPLGPLRELYCVGTSACQGYFCKYFVHPVTERTFTKGFLGAKPHAGREHMVSKTASASWSFRTKVGRRTMT